MKHSLALLKLRWERKKKLFPAEAGSDFKINPLPSSLCSFYEEQLGSKFHLHKVFVVRGSRVIYHTREIRRKWQFADTGINPLVMKHKKKYWPTQKQHRWLTSTGSTKKYQEENGKIKQNIPAPDIFLSFLSFFLFLELQMVARKVHCFPQGGGNARPSRACLIYYS